MALVFESYDALFEPVVLVDLRGYIGGSGLRASKRLPKEAGNWLSSCILAHQSDPIRRASPHADPIWPHCPIRLLWRFDPNLYHPLASSRGGKTLYLPHLKVHCCLTGTPDNVLLSSISSPWIKAIIELGMHTVLSPIPALTSQEIIIAGVALYVRLSLVLHPRMTSLQEALFVYIKKELTLYSRLCQASQPCSLGS